MTRRRLAPAGALLTLAALLVMAAPAPAAVSVRGTVVHRNARTHSFVIASATGHLTKVRSRHAARLGRTVRATGRRMRDASLDASTVRTGARHRAARLRGTVTFASRRTGRFTVSSAAGSISVRHRTARARAAADDLPAVGMQVVVTVTVQPGAALEEDEVDEVGEDQGQIEIEGVVKSLDLAAHTVTVSASDDDETTGTVTVGFPATFDLTKVMVGHEIELKANRQADGTFVLSKLETGDEDELENEADDDNAAPGAREPGDDNDNNDDNHGGGD
jgi:hypothetical protein